MGFADDLEAETTKSRCNVALLAKEMEPNDRADFLAAVANVEEVPSNVILRAVARGKYGRPLGVRSLKTHREHRCSCFEENV